MLQPGTVAHAQLPALGTLQLYTCTEDDCARPVPCSRWHKVDQRGTPESSSICALVSLHMGSVLAQSAHFNSADKLPALGCARDQHTRHAMQPGCDAIVQGWLGSTLCPSFGSC